MNMLRRRRTNKLNCALLVDSLLKGLNMRSGLLLPPSHKCYSHFMALRTSQWILTESTSFNEIYFAGCVCPFPTSEGGAEVRNHSDSNWKFDCCARSAWGKHHSHILLNSRQAQTSVICKIHFSPWLKESCSLVQNLVKFNTAQGKYYLTLLLYMLLQPISVSAKAGRNFSKSRQILFTDWRRAEHQAGSLAQKYPIHYWLPWDISVDEKRAQRAEAAALVLDVNISTATFMIRLNEPPLTCPFTQ